MKIAQSGTTIDEQSTRIFAAPRVKNKKSIMLRKTIMMVVLISLIAGPLIAQEGKVTSLVTLIAIPVWRPL